MNYFHKLREQFLDFFKERGHTIVKSSSLIPDDSSVLLTTAGMQQFKRYYTGEFNPESDFGSRRTTSLQKCFRTSDIEEVGDDTHLTFFEMMGNFSFGDYFKKEAIVWGYEFITNILQINPERVYVTVFEGDEENKIPKDEESYSIWYKEIGIPQERIFYGNKKDNFWGPTGNEGPCGPTTEIYVAPSAKDALAQNGVEIWNIVFNEFYKTQTNADITQINAENSQHKSASSRRQSAVYRKVDTPGIDTGMGFERLLATLEGVENVFETSAFAPIIKLLNEQATGISQRELRILADHIRSSSFLIADGIEPSNKGAGYVLRRLLRTIIAIKIKNDIHSDIFETGYKKVKEMFGEIYPEIKDEKKIIGIWQEENSKFQESINRGIKELSKYKNISGIDAFYIYETFGLPFELTKELAPQEAVKNISYEEFEKEFQKHQEVSRAGVEKKFGGHGLILDTGELKAGNEEELKKVLGFHTATHLLQWALRKVLNSDIHQMGSDINFERLRFDFNLDRKMAPEEIKQVEDFINEQINKNLPVYFKEMPKSEAEKVALSFFKEKYPDIVRVYFIGSEESGGVLSAEFCGGPHVEYTGQIGKFKISKEESVGKGVRRIRATTE
ncbi:MAG: alanine--tRNA ligase [Candidatus Paceibacterota bacterium]|jgi:alanyl-tRNA synthetase